MTASEHAPIHEACMKVRDLINVPRRSARLRTDLQMWHQICASLDVLEDSQLAIEAYWGERRDVSIGFHYLSVYGLLQSMFVQQTALKHLMEGLSFWPPPQAQSSLSIIREIRNDSVGHPTKSIRGRSASYHFISRPTLSPAGFQLLSYGPDGQQKFQDVSLESLRDEQQREILAHLMVIETRLMEEDQSHRSLFSSEKLANLFPDKTYLISKIYEAQRRPDMKELAVGCLNEISHSLVNLQEALVKRQEWESQDFIRMAYEALEWPLAELKKLYASGPQGLNHDEANLADVCTYALDGRLAELRSLVVQLDDSYSQG